MIPASISAPFPLLPVASRSVASLWPRFQLRSRCFPLLPVCGFPLASLSAPFPLLPVASRSVASRCFPLLLLKIVRRCAHFFLPTFHSRMKNCLRFANPAEALGGRHLEAWRRCMEAQKPGGSDTLILANCCIFLMAS